MDNYGDRAKQDIVEHPLLGNDAFKKILSTSTPTLSNDFVDELQQNSIPISDLDEVLPYMSNQSTFGPTEQQTTTFGNKFTAAVALENVTGQGIWQIDKHFGVFDSLLGGIDEEPFFLHEQDGKLVRYPTFSIHEYIRDHAADLNASETGKVILRNYSLGYYDGMNGKNFMRTVGYDIVADDMRQDLAKTTGSGIADFGAVMAGAAIDPVTLYGGRAVINSASFAKNLAFARSASIAWKQT